MVCIVALVWVSHISPLFLSFPQFLKSKFISELHDDSVEAEMKITEKPFSALVQQVKYKTQNIINLKVIYIFYSAILYQRIS